MPYWTTEEETTLINMVEAGKTVEEICEHFHRSHEAIKLKLRRLGAVIPQSQKKLTQHAQHNKLFRKRK